MLYAFFPIAIVLIATFVAEAYQPNLLEWRYTYAVLVFLTLPPFFVYLYLSPKAWIKTILPALFFIPLHALHEYTGLQLGQWEFNGEYLALVPFGGGAFVPIEELIFWIFLGSIITIAFYELYVDNLK